MKRSAGFFPGAGAGAGPAAGGGGVFLCGGDNRGQGPIFNRAFVLASRITMRDQPSLKGKTITRVPGGSEVTLISDANGWVQATYVDDKGNSYTGYLRDRYLAKNPVVLTLRQSGVAALAAPDYNAKHVGDLPRYTVLPVIGTWGNYYIVSLRNASAFVSMDIKPSDGYRAGHLQQCAVQLVTLRKTRRTPPARARTGEGGDARKAPPWPLARLNMAGTLCSTTRSSSPL